MLTEAMSVHEMKHIRRDGLCTLKSIKEGYFFVCLRRFINN